MKTEGQALQTAWQADSFKALIKKIVQCQALQTAWQCHSFKALSKTFPECQTLQTAGEGNFFEALNETNSKGQALEIAWQSHSLQALIETVQNVTLCRLLGKETPSRLWLELFPKVKLCRLLGNLAPVSLWLNIIPKASKGQALQTAWQDDSIQALIKINSEDRCLNCSVSWLLAGSGQTISEGQTVWQADSCQPLIKTVSECYSKLCRLLGRVTDSHWKRRRKWSFWGSEGGGTNTHHLLSPVPESDPAMNIFPQTQGSWRRSAMQYNIRWNIRAWKGHSLKCPAPAMFGWVWAVKPGAASLAPFSGSCSWFPCGPLAQSGTSEGQAAAFTCLHHGKAPLRTGST